MSEDRSDDTGKAEAQALEIRAQMRTARRKLTEAAARVLRPDEPRSFGGDPEAPPNLRRDS